jgi:adenine phosphoribosyltransferase
MQADSAQSSRSPANHEYTTMMPASPKHDQLRAAVRDVPDFPKPGILFKDITPVLADAALFRDAIEIFAGLAKHQNATKVVGIDARGFIFGAAVALHIGAGFVPMRKRGKLPWMTESASYALEYGEAVLEVHRDAVLPGERVLLVDDLLATGGTAAAAVELIHRLGGVVAGAHFLIELGFLDGRLKLPGIPVEAVLHY